MLDLEHPDCETMVLESVLESWNEFTSDLRQLVGIECCSNILLMFRLGNC